MPLHVASQYQSIFRRLGLDGELIFSHPLIKPWRTLEDRENCTLDTTRHDGRPIRLHIKRYQPVRRRATPADYEVAGFQLLQAAGIPVAPLVGWGSLADGRSFIVTEDLAGHRPADKLVESGAPFDRLLEPTADLTAQLHRAGLHHRDLYLCHFFAKLESDRTDLKLIDVARVKRLPSLFTRQRWIVKDLAQLWYSTLKLPITDAQRDDWLTRYAHRTEAKSIDPLRRAIERKVARISKHDHRLNRVQPGRNISIPQ
jgi:lipopolysaccharide kinase (Kdo/WaaP) family protein